MPARLRLLARPLLPLLLCGAQAAAQSLPALDGAATAAPEPMGGPAAQLSIVNTRALAFGRFVAGSGGAITMAPSGARSRSGGVILLNSAGSGSAGFSVTTLNGSGSTKSVILSLPADGVATLASGPHSMSVRTFTSGSGTLIALPPSGAAIDVGATLSVAPNQAAGSYTGTFQVTVNYQ